MASLLKAKNQKVKVTQKRKDLDDSDEEQEKKVVVVKAKESKKDTTKVQKEEQQITYDELNQEIKKISQQNGEEQVIQQEVVEEKVEQKKWVPTVAKINLGIKDQEGFVQNEDDFLALSQAVQQNNVKPKTQKNVFQPTLSLEEMEKQNQKKLIEEKNKKQLEDEIRILKGESINKEEEAAYVPKFANTNLNSEGPQEKFLPIEIKEDPKIDIPSKQVTNSSVNSKFSSIGFARNIIVEDNKFKSEQPKEQPVVISFTNSKLNSQDTSTEQSKFLPLQNSNPEEVKKTEIKYNKPNTDNKFSSFKTNNIEVNSKFTSSNIQPTEQVPFKFFNSKQPSDQTPPQEPTNSK